MAFTIVTVSPESIDHIMRQTKWDHLGLLKCQALKYRVSYYK
jgi:hypothetical protein